MLRKSYAGEQFTLTVSFKHDKELPLGQLLKLEDAVSTSVRLLAESEVIALDILEEKTDGKANT